MTTLKKMLPLLAFVLCLASCGGKQEEPVEEPFHPYGFDESKYIQEHDVVKNGETFTTLLRGLGFSAVDAYEMTQMCDTVFDVRKLRAGNRYATYYSGDSVSRRLEYLVYEQNRIRSTIFKCADSLAVWN